MERSNSLIPEELQTQLLRLSRRPWLLERVKSWLTGRDRFFLLSGGPGTGKTMVSALVLDTPLGRESPWAASYFCSKRLRGYSNHPRQFTSHLQRCLIQRFPKAYTEEATPAGPLMDLHGDVKADEVLGSAIGVNVTIGQLVAAPMSPRDHFQTAVVDPLYRIQENNMADSVGLVIDGLDEALTYGSAGIVHLLHNMAASLPTFCKVFLTTQNSPAVIDRLLESLGDIERVDLSDQEHRPAVNTDIHQYAEQALAEFSLDLVRPSRELAEIIAASTQGNFLQADGLIRQIEKDGQADLTLEAHDLQRYYLSLFDRQQALVDGRLAGAVAWTNDCLPVLHLIAASQSPLQYDELLALLRWENIRLAGTIQAIANFLEPDPLHSIVRLEHQAVAAFLLSGVLDGRTPNPHGVSEADAHKEILGHIAEYVAISRWEGAPRYGVLYTGAHLQRLNQLDSGSAELLGAALDLAGLCRRIATCSDLGEEAFEASSSILGAFNPVKEAATLQVAIVESGQSDNPYVRAAAVERLLQLSEEAPRSCTSAVMAILQGTRIQSWSTALQAISRLTPQLRDELIYWVATSASTELATWAAYALYLIAGSNRSLIASEILLNLAGHVSLLRPRQAKRLLDFLAHVSITAYCNHCDQRQVALATSKLWRYTTVKRLHLNLINRPILEGAIVSVAANRLAARIVENDLLRDELGSTPARFQRWVPRLLDGLQPGKGLTELQEPLLEGLSGEAWLPKVLSACVIAVQAATATSDAELEELFRISPGEARLWEVASLAVLMEGTPASWPNQIESMVQRIVADNPEALSNYLRVGSKVDFFFASLFLSFAKRKLPLVSAVKRLDITGEAHLRRSVFEGLSVVGLYYPEAVLSAMGKLAVESRSEEVLIGIASLLGRLYPVHPRFVDVFRREMGNRLLPATPQGADMEFARKYVDLLGLYNNGVHQAVHYPIMRERVLKPAFLGLLEAHSPEEFVRAYAPAILELLRDGDYDLMQWTVGS